MRFQLDIILSFFRFFVHFLSFLTLIQCTLGSVLPQEITIITGNSGNFSETHQFFEDPEGNLYQKNVTQTQATPHLSNASALTEKSGNISETHQLVGNPEVDLHQENVTQSKATPHLSNASAPILKLHLGIDHLGVGLRPKFKHRDPDGWLAAHNAVRSLYGAANLTWSGKLARAAKKTTDTCIWAHTQNDIYGENIAAGQENSAQVLNDWVNGPDEKTSYDPNNPNYSHFTQVIWKGSRKVGCALTTCDSMQGVSLPQSPILFWACEYHPPGNVLGYFDENVHSGKGGSLL